MNDLLRMTYRETDVVDFRALNQEYLRPERICIQFDKDIKVSPLDIGCLAYAVRGRGETQRSGKCRPVDQSTLIINRRDLLRRILESLFGVANQRTVEMQFRYLSQILDWCDAHGHSNAFADVRSAKSAYHAYTQYLNQRILQKQLVPVSASNVQRKFSRIIDICLPEDHKNIISVAIPILFNRGGEIAPRDVHVKEYLSACVSLARRVSAFVLGEHQFPLVLEWSGFEGVIFPSNQGVITTYSPNGLSIYNGAARRIASVEEYMAAARKNGRRGNYKASRREVAVALERMDLINADPRHSQRLRLASLAAKAYACIFLAITGASPAEFVKFDYEEGLEIERSLVKKEFSAVKIRAGGKKTRYAIGRKNGLDLLREYLKLREWILAGKVVETLFFSMDKNGDYTGEFSPLSPIFARVFYRAVSGIYLTPQCPSLTSRSFRKYKSVVLHSLGFSPETVADVLNHQVVTNISSYSHSTPEQQEAEFSNYWQSVRRAAQVVCEQGSVESVSTPSGHCDGFNAPSPAEGQAVSIQPSCKTQLGCLYCVHYTVHSDESDVHKLMSLKYVVNAVRDSAPDIHHAETLYKDLSVRIGFVLEGIAARSSTASEMVASIERKVYELGLLTPFWESRLQRYEKLGVVF